MLGECGSGVLRSQGYLLCDTHKSVLLRSVAFLYVYYTSIFQTFINNKKLAVQRQMHHPPMACRGRSRLMNSALPAPAPVWNLAGPSLLEVSGPPEERQMPCAGVRGGARAGPGHTCLPPPSAQHHCRLKSPFSKALSSPKQFCLRAQDSRAGFPGPFSLPPCGALTRVRVTWV